MNKKHLLYTMLSLGTVMPILGAEFQGVKFEDGAKMFDAPQNVNFKLNPAPAITRPAIADTPARQAIHKQLAAANQLLREKKFNQLDETIARLQKQLTPADVDIQFTLSKLAIDSARQQQKIAEAVDLSFDALKNYQFTSGERLNILNGLTSFMPDKAQAAQLGLLILQEPGLDDNGKFNTQISVIDNLLAAKLPDLANKLADEMLTTATGYADNQQARVFNIKLRALLDLNQIQEAMKSTQEFAQKSKNLNDKYNFLSNQAVYYQNKAFNQPDKAAGVYWDLANDKQFNSAQRALAFERYAGVISANKKLDSSDIITQGNKLAKTQLEPGDLLRIHRAILKTAIKTEAFDEARRIGMKMLQDTNSPLATRIEGAVNAAEAAMLKNDFKAADDILNTAKNLPELTFENRLAIAAGVSKFFRYQEQLAPEIAEYQTLRSFAKNDNEQNKIDQAIVSALVYFRQIDDAAKIYIDKGDFLKAAGVYHAAGELPKARVEALKVLSNTQESMKKRQDAFSFFIDAQAENQKIADQYADIYFTEGRENIITFVMFQQISTAMRFADYAYAKKCFDRLFKFGNWMTRPNLAFYYTNCLLGLGDKKAAADFAAECADNAKLPVAIRYRLALTAAVTAAPQNQQAIQEAIKKCEQKYADLMKQLDNKSRSEALLFAGRSAMIAGDELAAKTIYKYYQSLFVPEPTKSYTISYSPERVGGIAGYEKLKEKLQVQKMDRKYGGNMDFLITDVSTGNRGDAVGVTKDDKHKFTEFSAVADADGVYFFFRAFDPNARDVEAKLLGAGCYEIYMAPGANQPYYCLLPDLQSGLTGSWDTSYNNQGHRRIDKKSVTENRTEHVFLDDGYVTSVFMSWDLFYDKLPLAQDTWEFENIHWGRSGGFSWNGVSTIHGRSSWGKLKFDLPPAGLKEIKKKQIYRALANYQAQKRTGREAGVIDFWRDPELGDLEFYNLVVVPYVEKLDSYIPLVSSKMSDADVEKVYNEAVKDWSEIRFKIDYLRRVYLEEKLSLDK